MAISIHDVHKSFGDFKAVDGVSLEVPEGSLTALLGPSGSGKSTLLRLIAGLESPDRGDIAIGGDPALQVPPQRRGIGFVFQHYAAFKHMSVRDNVAFGLKVRRRPKAEIRERVDELLSIVGLSGYADRYRTMPPVRVVHPNHPGVVTFSGLDESVWIIRLAWAHALLDEALPADVDRIIREDLLRPAAEHLRRVRWPEIHNVTNWNNAAIATLAIALGDVRDGEDLRRRALLLAQHEYGRVRQCVVGHKEKRKHSDDALERSEDEQHAHDRAQQQR